MHPLPALLLGKCMCALTATTSLCPLLAAPAHPAAAAPAVRAARVLRVAAHKLLVQEVCERDDQPHGVWRAQHLDRGGKVLL